MSRIYARLEDVDWARWTPVERATLLFARRDGLLLMIEKKRGLGAGKINGPGGRIEPGESAMDAAVREVQEEVCVTPTGVVERGILRFQFTDGFSIEGVVFAAEACIGEPRETGEAVPLWFAPADLPYGRMWADDRVWMPEMLAGRCFVGRFLFEGDRMLGHELETLDPSAYAARFADGRPRKTRRTA